MSSGTYRGKAFTPEADALALSVGKLVAKARATHADKFVALIAVIKALGVPDDHYATLAEQTMLQGSPQADTRHTYVPHPDHVFFCKHCGYAEHETLKHR